MDASTLPKGIAQEKSDKFNKPGLYRHPETGAELACFPGKRAVAQADGFVQVGYVRVGDVPSLSEIKAKDDAQIAKQQAEDAAAEQSDEPTVAELKAQLEAEQTARKAAEDAQKEAEKAAKKAEKKADKAAPKAEKAAEDAAEKPETKETASQSDGVKKENE